jgi:hypothetical protein
MKNSEILKIAKPGSIVFFKKMKFVDEIIRVFQALKSGRPSEWSHCAIKTFDDTLVESDFYFRGLKVLNGAMESRLGKYFNNRKTANIAVVECQVDEETARRVIECGRDLIKQRIKYAVAGLLGTMFNIIKLRIFYGSRKRGRIERERNIFYQRDTMYCSHFVLTCFKRAGVELLPMVDSSVATVEDLYRSTCRQSFIVKQWVGY